VIRIPPDFKFVLVDLRHLTYRIPGFPDGPF
jgi:hypothetical protein